MSKDFPSWQEAASHNLFSQAVLASDPDQKLFETNTHNSVKFVFTSYLWLKTIQILK